MGRMIGYMVTWTTYGSWLQGDKRGYVTDGKIYGGDLKLKGANVNNLSKSRVRLNLEERGIVKDAILKASEKYGQKIYAIAVMSNHVHIVLGNNGRNIGEMVRRYKRSGYFALRENGFAGKVWTRGYDKRYCYDEGKLEVRMGYVSGR